MTGFRSTQVASGTSIVDAVTTTIGMSRVCACAATSCATGRTAEHGSLWIKPILQMLCVLFCTLTV
jgi:hypothetical protein